MKKSLLTLLATSALAFTSVANAQGPSQADMQKMQEQLQKAQQIMQQHGISPEHMQTMQNQMMQQYGAQAQTNTANMGQIPGMTSNMASAAGINPKHAAEALSAEKRKAITAEFTKQLNGWNTLQEEFYDYAKTSENADGTITSPFPMYNISLNNQNGMQSLQNLNGMKSLSIALHPYNKAAFNTIYEQQLEGFSKNSPAGMSIKPKFNSGEAFISAVKSEAKKLASPASGYTAYLMDDFMNFGYDIQFNDASNPAAAMMKSMTSKVLLAENPEGLLMAMIMVSPGQLDSSDDSLMSSVTNGLNFENLLSQFQ